MGSSPSKHVSMARFNSSRLSKHLNCCPAVRPKLLKARSSSAEYLMLEMAFNYSSSIGSKARCRPLLPVRWAGCPCPFPSEKRGCRANGLFAYFEAYQRLLVEAKPQSTTRPTVGESCGARSLPWLVVRRCVGPLFTLRCRVGGRRVSGWLETSSRRSRALGPWRCPCPANAKSGDEDRRQDPRGVYMELSPNPRERSLPRKHVCGQRERRVPPLSNPSRALAQ